MHCTPAILGRDRALRGGSCRGCVQHHKSVCLWPQALGAFAVRQSLWASPFPCLSPSHTHTAFCLQSRGTGGHRAGWSLRRSLAAVPAVCSPSSLYRALGDGSPQSLPEGSVGRRRRTLVQQRGAPGGHGNQGHASALDSTRVAGELGRGDTGGASGRVLHVRVREKAEPTSTATSCPWTPVRGPLGQASRGPHLDLGRTGPLPGPPRCIKAIC